MINAIDLSPNDRRFKEEGLRQVPVGSLKV